MDADSDTGGGDGFGVEIGVDAAMGIGVCAVVVVPCVWAWGTVEKTVPAFIALGVSSVVAVAVARLAVGYPAAWRGAGVWPVRRRGAAAVAVVASAGVFAVMPEEPGWPWAALLGVLACPALIVLWTLVRRWQVARTLAKGEGSADEWNRLVPEARTARWSDIGELYGWRLGADRRTWTATGPSPWARHSLAGVLDLAEWRARWQRGAVELRRGTPELPGTDRTVTPDRMGVWVPDLMRQVVYAASGHGKSVLLSRLLVHALDQDADVLVVDGKGAAADADAWELAAIRAGVPGEMIRRWPDEPLRLLDELMLGTQVAMLTALIEQARGGQGHAFYEGEARTAITAALRWMHERDEPVTLAGLLEIFERPPADGSADAGVLTAEAQRGVTRAALAAQALRPVVDAIGDREGVDGWPVLPEPGWWRVGIVSANVTAVEGGAMVAAILQRLAAGVAERSGAERRPLLVIVDEAAAVIASSQLAADAAAMIAAQGRSAGMPCVWAFQDRSQIPEEWADAVETSAELMWVGRTGRPDRYLKIGGNRAVEEATRPGQADRIADTSVRAQTSYGMRPEHVETLPVWGWACYADGQWCAAFAPPLPETVTPGIEPNPTRRVGAGAHRSRDVVSAR